MDEQEIVPTGTEEVAVAEVETPEVSENAQEDQVDWEARAKAAEALIVKNKQEAKAAKKEEPKTETVATQPANVEEVVLRANGMQEEVLEKLKTVAKANNTDLLTAQKDEMFQAWNEKYEAGQKKAKASLGASNGSGGVQKKASFGTPGISADDHKAMFDKATGR